MAAPLRHALTLLTWGAAGMLYLPLIPGAGLLLTPAFSAEHWRALFADPQLPQAVAATLVSTLIAVVGALLIALSAIAACWPSRRWRQLASRLPLLLAVPHVAFATCALLLFAEGGALYRWLPFLSAVPDRYGIGVGLTLALKESGFLLWAIYALLGEKRLAEQAMVLQSQGYGRWQCLAWLVLPQLMPQLRVVLLATTAWTLSVVDVALVLGPGNPPTLAVLAWQWLSQGDDTQQAKGALACLLLLALLAVITLLALALWRGWRRRVPDFRGVRHPRPLALPGRFFALFLPLCGLLCVIVLALTSRLTAPSPESLLNSLWLGALSALLGALLCLAWLELGHSRLNIVIWLPLILPALPLVAGQYQLALRGALDGQRLTVLWGHLLWVFPWMLFVMAPAWRRIDPRLTLVARTLGWRRGRIFWLVLCPQMLRPLLSALAVGFSVSIAQYLPTLWLGGGRVTTLTTDAVALSSGGDTALLAAEALWQLLLPAAAFLLFALLLRLAGHYRQGLR